MRADGPGPLDALFERVSKDGALDWEDIWSSASALLDGDGIEADELAAWTRGIRDRVERGDVRFTDGGGPAYSALRQRLERHREGTLVAPHLTADRMRAIAQRAQSRRALPAPASAVLLDDVRFIEGPERGVGRVRTRIPARALFRDPIHAELLFSQLAGLSLDGEPPNPIDWALSSDGTQVALELEIEAARLAEWRSAPPTLLVDLGARSTSLRLFAESIVVDTTQRERAALTRRLETLDHEAEELAGTLERLEASLGDPERRAGWRFGARQRYEAAQASRREAESHLRARLAELRAALPALTGARLAALTARETGDPETDLALERVAQRLHAARVAHNVHAPMVAMLSGLREVEPDPERFAERFASLIAEERQALAKRDRQAERLEEARAALLSEPLAPPLWAAIERNLGMDRIELPERYAELRHARQHEEQSRQAYEHAMERLIARLRTRAEAVAGQLERAGRDAAVARALLQALESAPSESLEPTEHRLEEGTFLPAGPER